MEGTTNQQISQLTDRHAATIFLLWFWQYDLDDYDEGWITRATNALEYFNRSNQGIIALRVAQTWLDVSYALKSASKAGLGFMVAGLTLYKVGI